MIVIVEAPFALLRAEPLFFRNKLLMSKTPGRFLICSVGYGQGHHAAAGALAEELRAGGYACRVCDPCSMARPLLFSLTQAFYRFCVRCAPWLWAVTYAQTDTANWRKTAGMPLMKALKRRMLQLLQEEKPDVVLCTYPLYAYMLDALHAEGNFHGNYVMVVTDSLEISRPWLQSAAPLLVVPDRDSAEKILLQFGLPESDVLPLGFPVYRAFRPGVGVPAPEPGNVRFLMSAHRSTREVIRSVQALLAAYPAARVTLLAGEREPALSRLLCREHSAGNVNILAKTDNMSALMAESHIYIGKAGAATMFECYAARLPMLVNFALPGQEQGNLERLLRDGAGLYAATAADLVHAVSRLLANGAAEWRRMRSSMAAAGYDGAAARIAAETKRRFFS